MRLARTFGLALAGSLASLPALGSVDSNLGPLAPQASVSLLPSGDGVLRYTTIDIPEQVLVSIDRSGFTGPVTLAATGDIRIAGALDGGLGELFVQTPGAIFISGKTYGGQFSFQYGEFHRINNPGGYPDERYAAPGAHLMVNDGILPLPPGQGVEQTNAGTLTGGVVMTWVQIPVPETVMFDYGPSLTAVFSNELQPVALDTSAVPVPPALGLFATGLAVLGAAARRRLGSDSATRVPLGRSEGPRA